MKHKPNITIRMGAAAHNVTIDGVTIDRSKLDRAGDRKLTRMMTAGLDAAGYFNG
jgi:hypothetical protein